jgi:hypothetical protein
MMVFVDGENLVNRYQSMLQDGRESEDGVQHLPDTYVWVSLLSPIDPSWHYVIRATYYTYAVGDDDAILKRSEEIASLRPVGLLGMHSITRFPLTIDPQRVMS